MEIKSNPWEAILGQESHMCKSREAQRYNVMGNYESVALLQLHVKFGDQGRERDVEEALGQLR